MQAAVDKARAEAAARYVPSHEISASQILSKPLVADAWLRKRSTDTGTAAASLIATAALHRKPATGDSRWNSAATMRGGIRNYSAQVQAASAARASRRLGVHEPVAPVSKQPAAGARPVLQASTPVQPAARAPASPGQKAAARPSSARRPGSAPRSARSQLDMFAVPSWSPEQVGLWLQSIGCDACAVCELQRGWRACQ